MTPSTIAKSHALHCFLRLMTLAHGGSITLKQTSVCAEVCGQNCDDGDVMNQLAKFESEDASSVDPAQALAAALQDVLHMHADDIHCAVGEPIQRDAEPRTNAVAAAKQGVEQDTQSDAMR